MISPPPSSTVSQPRSVLGKPLAGENPTLSPKGFPARHDEDQLKRRHVHPVTQPSRRAPLDPLLASDLENRRNRQSQSTDSHHSLVTPSSQLDLRALLPEQPVRSGYCGIQPSGASSAQICSWPPHIPAPDLATPSHSLAGQPPSQSAPPCSSDSTGSPRGALLETTTSTWHAPDFFETEPTTAMIKPMGWKSKSALQPIQPRTNSVPTVCRPPGVLWRSDSGPTKADHDPIGAAHPLVCPIPPGLPPPRPELRRNGPDSDPLSHGSLSLSLALGSQPLRASDHTKAVPPIGAERSRVVSMAPLRSHTRNVLAAQSGRPSPSPCSSSPLSSRLQAKWKSDVYLLDTTSLEKVQAVAGDSNMSREGLERLLRHAIRNKHAPKIISPLNPLRSATSGFDLSTDPEYQLRMPSQANNPSPRYSKCLLRRARTICERYQSVDWDSTCMHCQECKRDTIGKRLLAFRYHQHQTQRNKPLAYPTRGTTTSVMDDARIVLADRIREMFAYEMDEEEKSLWEEVAAITGAGPQPFSFSRVGAPCAAAAHRRAVDDGSDEGHDDYLESPDECLLANASATLFRDVTVY